MVGQADPGRWRLPAEIGVVQDVRFAQLLHGRALDEKDPQQETLGLVAKPRKGMLGLVAADVPEKFLAPAPVCQPPGFAGLQEVLKLAKLVKAKVLQLGVRRIQRYGFWDGHGGIVALSDPDTAILHAL